MKAKKSGEKAHSKVSSPWKGRLQDDSRAAIQSLESQNWNPDLAYTLLLRPLTEVISKLHFNSPGGAGLPSAQEEIRHLSKEFLLWMNRGNRWNDWKSAIEESPSEAPMGYYLARFWARFERDRPLSKNFESLSEPSYSSKRSMLELSQASDLISHVTDSAMSLFSSLSLKLKPQIRLVYDLHLEGLLNEEVAWVTGHPVDDVEKMVREAKETLLGLASGGGNSREGT